MHEHEANHMGLILLAEVGIDPQARLGFVERLSVAEGVIEWKGKHSRIF